MDIPCNILYDIFWVYIFFCFGIVEDTGLQNIIDKLAEFVARNGPEFETITKAKQQSNPRFSFLFGGDFYQYYQWRVSAEQASEFMGFSNFSRIHLSNQNKEQHLTYVYFKYSFKTNGPSTRSYATNVDATNAK